MTIYRVRKTADDIKSQRGAYFKLENAVKKAKLTGCNVYTDYNRCVWKNPQKFKFFVDLLRKL